MMYYDDKICCPCCGKVMVRRLTGIMENNCPFCKRRIKIIVDDQGISIFSTWS